MTERALVSALVAVLAGCGSVDSEPKEKSGCQKGCEAVLKDQLAEALDAKVSCSDRVWAGARDCDSCQSMVLDEFGVQMIFDDCFCSQYFGEGELPPFCGDSPIPFRCNEGKCPDGYKCIEVDNKCIKDY